MTKKLDKEHLEAITKLREEFSKTTTLLGSITIEDHTLREQLKIIESHRDQLLIQFQQLQTQETKLIETLKERYGDGQIDVDAGTFTPVE
jgi:predicted transcriptional regulator